MTSEHEEPVLSEKDMEVIAVGASVASGCLPCTRFHLRAASQVGADAAETLQAVRDATQVRMAATAIMARAGGAPLVEPAQPVADSGARPLIRELVSISAAYAVNCSTSLEAHVAAARALGATDQQVFAAIKIACAVKDMAGSKVRSAAAVALGATEEEAAACGCGEGDDAAPGRASDCDPGDAECSCSPDPSRGRKEAV